MLEELVVADLVLVAPIDGLLDALGLLELANHWLPDLVELLEVDVHAALAVGVKRYAGVYVSPPVHLFLAVSPFVLIIIYNL